jgi:hypothetical protein
MSTGTATSHAQRSIDDRVALRAMYARRRRIWQRLTLVVVVTSVMVYLASSHRDAQGLRRAQAQAELMCEALRLAFAQTHTLPRRFPKFGDDRDKLGALYQFNILYPDQLRTTSPVGVFCSARPVSLLLKADGRFVATYDGREFRVSWMEEPEFQRRARSLGFASLAQP